jgi:hypothetical protein
LPRSRDREKIIVPATRLFGVSVPAALHALRLDPKLRRDRLTLAFTDRSSEK